MARSRYLWLIGISLVCVLGIVAWQTPQKVVTALAKPQFADSPRASVQRYWNFLDTRQTELAEKMILTQSIDPATRRTIEIWQERVKKNPLLSLKNVEFLDLSASSAKVRVTWSSPIEPDISAIHSFDLRNTSEGWKIIRIK